MLDITHRPKRHANMQSEGEGILKKECFVKIMDVEGKPDKLEGSLTTVCHVKEHLKQDNINSHEDQVKSRKRPFKDLSTGFTKAVIICNSSELTRSKTNTYRPNNIVIEMLKKNPMRYGKVTFHRFTSEKEVREELSSRFPVLENKTFWFSSADQYGKLNFRELEEWSGRNVRRWLPGSSAMYIILETSRAEERSNSELDTDSSTPYSGISCTTIRADTTYPITWRANDSQRALLDFLASSKKLCNTKKKKMVMVNADEKKSKTQSQSSKSPARLDLRFLALHTQNERISDAQLSSDTLRRQNSSSLLSEAEIIPKKRLKIQTSHCQSKPSFAKLNEKTKLNDTELENHKSLKEKQLQQKAQCSKKSNKTTPRIHCENSQENDVKSSNEPFISKNILFSSGESSSESLESMDEWKESTILSSERNVRTDHPDGSTIPGRLSPYYLLPDPCAVFGAKIQEEQKEKENKPKVPNGYALHDKCLPMPAVPVPSTGFFPPGQSRQNSLGFVPLEVLSQFSRVVPYRLAGSTTSVVKNEALEPDLSHMNNMTQKTYDANIHVMQEERINSLRRPKDTSFVCLEGSTEAYAVGPNNTTKVKNKDLIQKFLEIADMEGKKREQNLFNCEMFPCSAPCQGGPSFIVVLNKPLEDRFNQAASFCAKFKDASVVELIRVDHSTLKGISIPESQESGHVTVHILENNHVIGCASFRYEEGFIEGLKSVMFSGDHSEKLLKFLTSTENERVQMQDDLIDWLELVVFMSSQKGHTSVLEKILCSQYGEAVRARCSRRTTKHLQLAINSGHAECSRYLKNKFNRNYLENEKSIKIEETIHNVEYVAHEDSEQEKYFSSTRSDSEWSAHEYTYDKSREHDIKESRNDSTKLTAASDYKADNLMLLSSIASRMETSNVTSGGNRSSPFISKEVSNGTTTSAAPYILKGEICNESIHDREERSSSSGGFLKKVFVLPPNSLYLPSQSDLCKLRGTRSSYCKVFFNAEMNEDDVYEQIRRAFDNLAHKSFRLAVVDQTGKLVFYDGFWTGKIIRRKLRGNSVLYVIPINAENQYED